MTLNYQDKFFDEAIDFQLGEQLPEGSELIETTTKPGTTRTIIEITIPDEGVSGDVVLFDMIADTNADEFRHVYSSLFSTTTMQINKGPRIPTKIGLHPIYPAISQVDAGYLSAEGLLTDKGGIDYSRDYSMVGAAIQLKGMEGTSYPARLEANGRIYVDKLPVTVKNYTMVIDVPGHYTTYTPLEVGYQANGIDIGEWISYRTAVSKPGDMNKDDVVDIYDALLLQEYWGTDNRNTDINFDGTTDELDFQLLEKYYLSENDFVLDTPDPQSEASGKNIEKIKLELGMTP